jgi:hypothetical protein
MAPKKTISSRAQSPLVAQRALLAEQKRLAKASRKEAAMATECGRQRQLLVTLLPFSRAVQAALCEYEAITDEYDDVEEIVERNLKATVDNAVLLYQQQQQIFAAGVKKGKQFRLLQSLFDKVDFQMRMVYREYAYNKEVLKKIEAKIADFKAALDPLLAEDLVAAERRQQDTSTIIAFKAQALDLLMTAVMIEDKDFFCRIGTVPLVSTTAELPASESQPAPDADMNAADESVG